jgi:hypothetical protein
MQSRKEGGRGREVKMVSSDRLESKFSGTEREKECARQGAGVSSPSLEKRGRKVACWRRGKRKSVMARVQLAQCLMEPRVII